MVCTGEELKQPRRGFSPEILVLGKSTRLPGSIRSDNLLPAHCLADSDTAQGAHFRKQLAFRETARKAFHSADNDEAIRRAMLRRSAPHRGLYSPGEWVMVFKESSGNQPGTWIGPQKVVVHENQHTIWTTMSCKLYRSAPENIRPVTTLEARNIIITPNEPNISEIARHIPADSHGDITQYRSVGNPSPSPIVVNPGSQEIPSPPAEETPPVEPHGPPSAGQPSSEGQPDQEPEALNPEEAPPISGVEVHIPTDTEDDELQCTGLYCNDLDSNALETERSQWVWKQEVYITERMVLGQAVVVFSATRGRHFSRWTRGLATKVWTAPRTRGMSRLSITNTEWYPTS